MFRLLFVNRHDHKSLYKLETAEKFKCLLLAALFANNFASLLDCLVRCATANSQVVRMENDVLKGDKRSSGDQLAVEKNINNVLHRFE